MKILKIYVEQLGVVNFEDIALVSCDKLTIFNYLLIFSVQVNVVVDAGNADFFDPLRGGINNDAEANPPEPGNLNEVAGDPPMKEWTSFRRLLMQRFPVSKMVSLSSVSFSVFLFSSLYRILKALHINKWQYLGMAEDKCSICHAREACFVVALQTLHIEFEHSYLPVLVD